MSHIHPNPDECIEMETIAIIHSWPHQWYGFWRRSGHDYDDLPPLQNATDATWNPDDKELLIQYLLRAPIAISAMSTSSCHLCAGEVPSLCYHWDGQWLWPNSLAHYVRCHSIALPDRFAQTIRDRGYSPPPEADLPNVPIRDLPWPQCWASMRTLSW